MFAVRYKGCYVDKIDRDFDDFRIDSQNLSVTFCAGQCAIKGKGHKPSDYAILYCVRKENDLRNLQVRGACGCLYSQKARQRYAENVWLHIMVLTRVISTLKFGKDRASTVQCVCTVNILL